MGKVAVSLQGPGDFSVRREWDIQVRAAQTPSAVDTVTALDPGRELTLSRDLTAGFAAGTSVVSVALSRTPGIDVPGLLRALDKYPYGCLEQTTSRALPLLYYNDVALLGYGPGDPKIGDRVQDAIYRIVDMQISDGSFGMWGPYATPAAEWVGLCARFPGARPRTPDDRSGGFVAARAHLAQPRRRAVPAQFAGLCLVCAGQGGPR